MSKFIISEDLLNKIINVLAQRPYAEVAGLITEIQEDIKPFDEGKVKMAEVPTGNKTGS